MTFLIIPDCHGRKFWRQAIANNIGNVDKVIFLGDYLDPYQNEIEENPELMEEVFNSNSILCSD
jgi:predicted phosphodiesterase